MEFNCRRMLSWLVEDDHDYTREELYERCKGNISRLGEFNSCLMSLVKKGHIEEKEGIFRKTKKGVKKGKEINDKHNC